MGKLDILAKEYMRRPSLQMCSTSFCIMEGRSLFRKGWLNWIQQRL